MTNQLQTTTNNERIKSYFLRLERLTSIMEKILKHKPVTFCNDHFYTDKELSQKLKVSRRSLQEYRNAGKIPHIYLGGKILYRASDIEAMLQNGYREKKQ